ncbi:MAG TPA: sigma-70 family RNA polymerase sigma factor [Myxococcota bacterium]|nr:sigma-70 family RNA polymerase sigma factor [Myxococcota bacterium]
MSGLATRDAENDPPIEVAPALTDGERDVADLALLVRGDRQALARLYDRHAPLLLALGVRLLSDRREAEDVLHDCFVELWRHAGDYDPRRASVKTWIALRMRSRCIDRLRSAGWTRRETVPERTLESVAAPAHSDGADSDRLEKALDELPPEQREVLRLTYFEGLSSSEIAEKIRIPIGTVKSRVRAAMTRLRTLLGAHVE